jgi:hypothetical protein
MGKKLKSREARRRDVERAICAVLEAHSKRDVGPRAVERYDNFKPEYHNRSGRFAAMRCVRRRIGAAG